MYTGHFAVALAAAGAARRLPLALLIAAAFASDLIEAVVAAFNVADPTRVLSHSLPATMAAGAVFATLWRLRGGAWRDAALLCVAAMSHTFLDLVTGKKAWWPGSPPVGLQLYLQPVADFAVEGTLVLVAWAVWRWSLPPERRTRAASWLMLAVLLAAQAAAFVYYALDTMGADASALSKFIR